MRQGGLRVHPERALEIARYATDSAGGEFACHKTTKYNAQGDLVATKISQHCAGALIFADKQDRAHQMARINMRLGFYDPNLLDQAAFPLVFDDEDEMVAANTPT